MYLEILEVRTKPGSSVSEASEVFFLIVFCYVLFVCVCAHVYGVQSTTCENQFSPLLPL